MTLAAVTRWRDRISWLGAVLLLLIVLGIVDSLVAQVRSSPYALDVLPGQGVLVNGPVPERIKDSGALFFQSESPHVQVRIDKIHTGYWVGGSFWHGEIRVSPEAGPGTYRVMVKPRSIEPKEMFPIFFIAVHPDAIGIQKASKAVITRYLGIPPWSVSAAALPLAVMTFLAVFRFSLIRERMLLAEGKTEVVRIRRIGDQVEIAFGFGQDHGAVPGSRVALCNETGDAVASVEIVRSWPTGSIALADAACPVRTGQIAFVMEESPPRT